MKLYSLPHSPFASRVRLQIYHNDLPVEICTPENFGQAEFREINPAGKIPVLLDDELILPESTVILRYLDEKFPHKSLLPANSEQRAVSDLFMRFPDVYIQPPLFELFSLVFNQTDDQNVLASKTAAVYDSLVLLEEFMQGYPRTERGELDLADCCMIPIVDYCLRLAELFRQDLRLAELGSLQAWLQQVGERASVQQVREEMNQGFTAMLDRVGFKSQGN